MSSAEATVRGIRPEEHAALASVTVVAYQALLGGALSDPYLAELADVAGRAAVAEVLVAVDSKERVLGGVTYLGRPGPLAAIDDPAEAGIRFLAVAPDAQGRGVGAALVAACVQRARSDGKEWLSLQTTGPMTTAQRLYERAGFSREPARDRTVSAGLALLAYRLDLRRPA